MCEIKILESRGAVSLCKLLRGGRTVGFGVWSVRLQGWLCGGWDRPVRLREARAAFEAAPWEG
jgi:hypothetical protein